MAPNSRKGKKAWRKNISSTEVDEFVQQTTHQERRGPAVEALQDQQLFFVDKGRADEEAEAVLSGRKRKRREKILTRSQIIIQAAHDAIPVATVPKKKPKGKLMPPSGCKSLQNAIVTGAQASKVQKQEALSLDVWDQQEPEEGWVGGPLGKPRVSKAPPAPKAAIKAVTVELPGSSYNPDAEQHQEAVAQLVAAEMQRVLKRDLAPTAPPPMAPDDYQPPRDALDLLQVDAEPDEEEEPAAASAPTADGDRAEPAAPAPAARPTVHKTDKARRKEKRKREEELALEQKQKLKAQRRDIDSLRSLQASIEETEALLRLKRERRESASCEGQHAVKHLLSFNHYLDESFKSQAEKAEKMLSQPPKLGKIKFEPATVQVLTSDELTGSLREIRPCFAVAKDRFKSLEQRGLIEPRRLQPKKQRRKHIEYEKDARTEKAVAMQEEVNALRKKNNSMKAQAAKKAQRQ